MTLYEQIYHAINGKKSINKIAFKNHVFYISIYLDSIVKSNKIYCFSVTHKILNDWEEIEEGRYKKIDLDHVIQKIKKSIIQTILESN